MNKKVSSIKRLLPYMKPYGLSYFWAILLTIISDIGLDGNLAGQCGHPAKGAGR